MLTLSARQRIIVFMILVLCFASLPLSMFFQQRQDLTSEDDGGNADFASYADRILLVRLSGMIADKEDSGLLSLIGSTGKAKKQLKDALKNKHIKAVLLRVDSPGGTVAASQELKQAVLALRQAGKPVVVSMGDVAASGGYYVACAADRIVANPGTVTGSIGVIMNLVNLEQLEHKLGIDPEIVKSGRFKDLGSPHHALGPEEKKLLQAIIVDSYNQFVTSVAQGRKMSEQAVRKLADGRIFTGRQALAAGLVDELGGQEDALASLQKITRQRYRLNKDLPVDDGGSKLEFFSKLLNATAGAQSPAMLDHVLPACMKAGWQNLPLYLMP